MSATPVKQSTAFIETEIDDEAVLMDLGSGDFFSLSGTAYDIWQLIDGTRDRHALVTALAEHYGAEAATIAADVDAFLTELGERGFIANG